MPPLIAGSAPAVGEGFDDPAMNACLAAPGLVALAVHVHSIQGDLDPATPPSPAIAASIPLDRSCGLDRSPVGHTREA
jgi:hypothetical protein